MRVFSAMLLVVAFGLCACSPAPPTAIHNQTSQETPTPKKDKSIHVSEKGW